MTNTSCPPVYFDHNATTPVKPAAAQAAFEALMAVGNPSSVHAFGRAAHKRVEDARAAVASLVGAAPKQVIFNSGASEGNATVLSGFSALSQGRILVSAIEHSSLLNSGVPYETIPVTPEGVVDLDALRTLLHCGPTPALVSVMLVNNETGVIQPVAEVAALAHEAGALVHTDAVQGAGKIPINMAALGVDFMTLAAHKLGGPQGIGALVVSAGTSGNGRACVPPPVLIRGGGQEGGARGGTPNVPGIAGFGVAAALAQDGLADMARIEVLRNRIEALLTATSPSLRIWGQRAPRVANTTLCTLPGCDAQMLMMAMDLAGVAISSGSACSSGTVKPSPVLTAMGATCGDLSAALRISLGWSTTADEVARFETVWQNLITRFSV